MDWKELDQKLGRMIIEGMQYFQPGITSSQPDLLPQGAPMRLPKKELSLEEKLSNLASQPLKRARVKGPGFFGNLQHITGMPSTEISIGIDNMEVPSLVPTLTRDEINFLLQGNKPSKKIADKAAEYAKMRASQGKSPFAQRGELEWPLPR